MLVGILEDKNDPFIIDIVSRLKDISVEFMSISQEKIPIEPKYRVVVDRLSYRYPFLIELLKNLALSGTYIINNPFAASATNKLIDMSLGGSLGLAFPKTIVLPDQLVIEETEGMVAQPDLRRVAEELGLPFILKPYNGYAWQDVYVIGSVEEFNNKYPELSRRHILVAQQLIRYKDYFRVFCFDKKDVLFIRWIPRPLAMGRYIKCDLTKMKDTTDKLADMTIQLNRALDMDVNVTEWCVDEEGRWWVIDSYNEVPDIVPEALPPSDYLQIVDMFSSCIKDKLDADKKNRTPFL
jgi:hypothetical protein